ncbi:unnamed protein product [Anisakis simplex]|uniref:G_PROTEIN_RECEP_F1_2 domain-containing protein n=1 Tax=Anisakis simplex TaxID=6269 RepID=A0A0M3J4C4_ANISI|nr:unnamed protein product [Anisakis simplex]
MVSVNVDLVQLHKTVAVSLQIPISLHQFWNLVQYVYRCVRYARNVVEDRYVSMLDLVISVTHQKYVMVDHHALSVVVYVLLDMCLMTEGRVVSTFCWSRYLMKEHLIPVKAVCKRISVMVEQNVLMAFVYARSIPISLTISALRMIHSSPFVRILNEFHIVCSHLSVSQSGLFIRMKRYIRACLAIRSVT